MPAAARRVRFGGGTIPVVSPEHLIVRKAVLDRAKDWTDIDRILAATAPLDVSEIRHLLERLVGPEDARAARLGALLAPG